jgi:23S rRNA (cytidine2498-2'-O)-methyltransferase
LGASQTLEQIKDAQITLWIGTSNAKYGGIAIHELKLLFPSFKLHWFIPGDVFMFTVAETRKSAIQVIRGKEPIFLRHIQPVQLELQVCDMAEIQWDQLPEFKQMLRSYNLAQKRVAVHVRKASQTVELFSSPLQLKQTMDVILMSEYEAVPCVQQMDYMISIFLHEEKVYVGVSQPEDQLSSWSGGAIHYGKSDMDISRAKFKLMEAELRFSIDFSQYRTALDLGAAPGGWSSFLLERGVQVTAVDPAKMHPSLLLHRGFQHLRMTAAELPIQPNVYDLIVSDMSWDPFQMANALKSILSNLVSGGTVIATIKLMHDKPLSTLRSIEQILRPYLILHKAKQLFHNREELTTMWFKVDG